MPVENYKRYVNVREPGLLCFVTTRCLDWAHLFSREEMRSRMCVSLLRDCEKYHAKLYAYVIMSNHMHFVVRPNEYMNISQFMRKVKGNSILRLGLHFDSSEIKQLAQQSGLNNRQFWQVSFRANPLHTREVTSQKVAYTNLNPVRAKLVDEPSDYIWSSAYVMNMGLFNDDESLDLRACKSMYEEMLGGKT